MAKLVSNVYGDAIFELCQESDKYDEFLEEAQGILAVLGESDDFAQMMSHPKINKEEKLSIVEAVFKGRISDEMVGLLRMLVEKNHAQDMSEVLEYFIDKVYEYKHIGKAKVVSAIALNDEQKSQVEKRLIETTSYESMDISYTVDESLIGGMIIRIGDRVVDSSVKTKLASLTRELSQIQLKVGECAS